MNPIELVHAQHFQYGLAWDSRDGDSPMTLQECYEILGLELTASSQDVRTAYIQLVKRWHPDSQASKLQSEDPAQEHFLRIQKAYEQIKRHQSSTATAMSDQPFEPKNSAQTITVSPERKAEILYANASDLGRQGLYQDAIAELSRALRFNPNYALAYKYRGHLRSLLGLERQADADLNKAKVLETLGSDAFPRSPSDLEDLARRRSKPKRRQPQPKRRSRPHVKRRNSPALNKKVLVWSLVGAAVCGALVFLNYPLYKPDFSPGPLNLDSQPIES